MKYTTLTIIILLILAACTKFESNNPVDPDVKKDPLELTSPADFSYTNDNTPTFTWIADEEATAYGLQVDNNSDFSSPEINQSDITTNTKTPIDTLPDGQYFWRVRTRYGQEVWKDWSNTWSFTLSPLPVKVGLMNSLCIQSL